MSRFRPWDLALLAAGLSVLVALLGIALLRLDLTLASGNRMSLDRATFTSVNAMTLTGFDQAFARVGNYRTGGRVIVTSLTLLGSIITIVLGGVLAARLLGRAVSMSALLSAAAATIFVAAVAGLGFSPFTMLSSVTGSGLRDVELPGPGSRLTLLSILPMAVIAQLGVPLLMASVRKADPTRWRLSTRTLLASAALIYVTLVGLLTLCGRAEIDVTTLASASSIALDARGPGLGLTPMNTLTRPQELIVGVSMLLGGVPGGAGSSVVLVCVSCLVGGLWSRDRMPPYRLLRTAVLGLFGFAALYVIVVGLLLYSEPQSSLERLWIIAASALGNVGLSGEPIGFTGLGLYVLTVAMLLGKIGSIAMLAALCEALAPRSSTAPVVADSPSPV